MFLIASLSALFMGSLWAIQNRIARKIPELVAIPDQVITQRFQEDSARLRLFILHFKAFYRERRYRRHLANFVERTLYRFHLLLLRLDNFVVSHMKRSRLQRDNRLTELSVQIESTIVSGEPGKASIRQRPTL